MAKPPIHPGTRPDFYPPFSRSLSSPSPNTLDIPCFIHRALAMAPKVTSRWAHAAEISAVAYAPDGRYVSGFSWKAHDSPEWHSNSKLYLSHPLAASSLLRRTTSCTCSQRGRPILLPINSSMMEPSPAWLSQYGYSTFRLWLLYSAIVANIMVLFFAFLERTYLHRIDRRLH